MDGSFHAYVFVQLLPFIVTDLSVLTVASHDYSTVCFQEQNRLTETHDRYVPCGVNNTERGPNRTKTRETVTIKEVQEGLDTATSSSEVRPACAMHPVVIYPGMQGTEIM